jgi:hypothetical protein
MLGLQVLEERRFGFATAVLFVGGWRSRNRGALERTEGMSKGWGSGSGAHDKPEVATRTRRARLHGGDGELVPCACELWTWTQ